MRRLVLYIVWASLAIGCESPPEPTRAQRYESAWQRHDAAVERIKSLGGKVFPERIGPAVTLHHASRAYADAVLAAADDLIGLDSISLVDAPPSPGWVGRFRGEPYLRYIAVADGSLALADIEALSGLPALESLHLVDVGLTDGELATLVTSAPGLRELTLAGDRISDGGAAWLTELRQLRTLRLSGTAVSDKQIARLLRRNPWLVVEAGDQAIYKGGWSGR